MSEVQKQIDRQGQWFRDAVEILFELPIQDVLSYGYSIAQLEEYMEEFKRQLRDKILLLFKDYKQYRFKDTGEPLEVNDVLDYALNFDGNLTQFKKHLKNASGKELRQYEKMLFETDLLLKNE